MNSSTALTLGFAMLLSACTVGPDFRTPAAPAAKTYISEQDVLTDRQRIALGQHMQTEWWTLFASPPLNGLVKQAIADNYDLRAAKETLAQAEETVRAESGSLWPQVGLDAAAGRQKYGVALFGPANFSIPPFSYYELGPSVSWTPDFFGLERRKIERQQALAEYQAHELDAAYVALTGNVASETLLIASSKAQIAAAQGILKEDTATLKLVQAAFAAGSDTQVDVLNAHSHLITDQALLPPLQQQLNVSNHALAILVGKSPAEWSPPELELTGFTLPRQIPVSLPSELVRKRPDILAAEANLHAASAAIGVATANLYPNITLSANTFQEALAPAGLFNSANNAWAMAAGVTAPIFNGGTLTAQQRAAEHAYQSALAQYRQTIIVAFGQVADALTGLTHSDESVAMLQQAVDTDSATLDLARKSYAAGNSGLLQIESAQRLLAQARLELVRAQSQRYLDLVRLFVALGGSPYGNAAQANTEAHLHDLQANPAPAN